MRNASGIEAADLAKKESTIYYTALQYTRRHRKEIQWKKKVVQGHCYYFLRTSMNAVSANASQSAVFP